MLHLGFCQTPAHAERKEDRDRVPDDKKMSLHSMPVSERIDLLFELLGCCENVFRWTYTPDGELQETTCRELVLNRIFLYSGCMEMIRNHARESRLPVMISVPLGLLWGAAFEFRDDELLLIHVLGPVSTENLSRSDISAALDKSPVVFTNRRRLINALEDIPIVSISSCMRSIQMLHYAITEEKIETSDVTYKSNQESGLRLDKNMPARDRMKTWMVENALMKMIRDGDINYKSALSQAAKYSSGVRLNSGSTLQQAKVSQIVFTSISTRAAIEGGISPEAAYTRGDSYIQDILNCKTLTEAGDIGHTMYDDFVHLVHKSKTNPGYSRQIQSCCEYIALHIDEKLSLSELASRIGYTDYYLSRKFREETGVGIGDYIKSAKIEKAKMLLESTEMSIQEICDTLSFGTRSFFAQSFKEIAGIPPAQYRKQNQKL